MVHVKLIDNFGEFFCYIRVYVLLLFQLRAVSLRDDYSQPHDRLSSIESTQDYTEPYQTKGEYLTKNCLLINYNIRHNFDMNSIILLF